MEGGIQCGSLKIADGIAKLLLFAVIAVFAVLLALSAAGLSFDIPGLGRIGASWSTSSAQGAAAPSTKAREQATWVSVPLDDKKDFDPACAYRIHLSRTETFQKMANAYSLGEYLDDARLTFTLQNARFITSFIGNGNDSARLAVENTNKKVLRVYGSRYSDPPLAVGAIERLCQ